MAEHFKAFSAVFPLILTNHGDKAMILLHRRQNTGYQDGKWDLAGSGHVDEGETAKAALVRECKEELGIGVRLEDIRFAHVSHRLAADRTYFDLYFVVSKYTGTPTIVEAEKCSDLQWFDLDALPQDLIACRLTCIQAYKKQDPYSEIVEEWLSQ